jgi:phytol kinase
MIKEFINIAWLSLSYIILFVATELLYHKAKVKGEYTRKIVHVSVGIITMLFPILLTKWWGVLIPCASFLILLTLSKKYNFLKSINDIDRVSLGSYLYPIIVFICFLIAIWQKQNFLYFYLPILIMALADPFAAIMGKKFGTTFIKFAKDKKTWIGTISFAILAFIITISFLSYHYSITLQSIIIALCISLSACLAECFSTKGYDNFTIPSVVIINLLIFNSYFQ